MRGINGNNRMYGEQSYCDLPSKAILKYRNLFVKISARVGSITQNMINILLKFID